MAQSGSNFLYFPSLCPGLFDTNNQLIRSSHLLIGWRLDAFTIIVAGAVDENFNRTHFTCSGDELDFLAPGLNIFSTVPDNNYAIMSGTSMSNPFAVGCASLLLSYNNKYHKYKLESIKDYISILSKSTFSISDETYRSKRFQGHGILKPNFI